MTRSRGARIGLAWAALAAILACGGSDGEASESAPTSPERRALEANLHQRQTYVDGPGAEEVADAAREALSEDDGLAVRVVDGTPRTVIVLVRYSEGGDYERLRDIPIDRRNAELDRIIEAIDMTEGTQADDVAVAIKGTIFYGALATRQAGQATQYHTGAVVDMAPLDTMLTNAAHPVTADEVGSGAPVEAAPGEGMPTEPAPTEPAPAAP
ncbi:MAG: hypothetical protein AB7S26_24885 [Sandaracinaceae bacterium]